MSGEQFGIAVLFSIMSCVASILIFGGLMSGAKVHPKVYPNPDDYMHEVIRLDRWASGVFCIILCINVFYTFPVMISADTSMVGRCQVFFLTPIIAIFMATVRPLAPKIITGSS